MEKEKVVVNHYRVLGLPSGEEGRKLDENQIRKAYRAKVLQFLAMFQRLNSSYAILKDPKARKQFDDSFPKRLVLTKDQKKMLFGLCYLVYASAPMAFPAARYAKTKFTGVATILCYHLAFEELRRRQNSQAATNNQETKSQNDDSYIIEVLETSVKYTIKILELFAELMEGVNQIIHTFIG